MALVPVLPFPEEGLTETAVKAWKRYFLTGVENESAMVNFFPFCSCDCLTDNKLLIVIL